MAIKILSQRDGKLAMYVSSGSNMIPAGRSVFIERVQNGQDLYVTVDEIPYRGGPSVRLPYYGTDEDLLLGTK